MKKVVLIFATIILLSTEVNCQWYYRKYGVNDLSQLSQEQLNERLRLDKKIMGFDIGALIIGSTAIIVGSYLINKANAEEITPIGGYNYLRERTPGIMFLSSGILCDILGLILIPVDLIEINKIKRILGNHQIKLGLINFKTYNTFNNHNISPAPVISLTIHFL